MGHGSAIRAKLNGTQNGEVVAVGDVQEEGKAEKAPTALNCFGFKIVQHGAFSNIFLNV
jgi:3-isopropylmalate dehydratase small subunit